MRYMVQKEPEKRINRSGYKRETLSKLQKKHFDRQEGSSVKFCAFFWDRQLNDSEVMTESRRRKEEREGRCE